MKISRKFLKKVHRRRIYSPIVTSAGHFEGSGDVLVKLSSDIAVTNRFYSATCDTSCKPVEIDEKNQEIETRRVSISRHERRLPIV